MFEKLKGLIDATNQTAKQNLTTHGYLEKVLIAMTLTSYQKAGEV